MTLTAAVTVPPLLRLTDGVGCAGREQLQWPVVADEQTNHAPLVLRSQSARCASKLVVSAPAIGKYCGRST